MSRPRRPTLPGGIERQWAGQLQVTYRTGAISVRIAERFTGKYVRSYNLVYKDSRVSPNKSYTDLKISQKFGAGQRQELLLNVSNLSNIKAPITGNINPGLPYPADRTVYDTMDAYPTVGVRFRR